MAATLHGYCLCGLAAALVSVLAHGSVTLFDFEDGNAPSVVEKTYSVHVTNAFATSGGHALSFKCEPWTEGMPEWPSFTLKTPIRDWSAYDRLAIDIVSLGSRETDKLNLFIAAPEGRVQNGLSRSLRLQSRRYVQWVAELNDWPKTTSVTNIGRVHIFTSHPQDVDVVIDRITLLEKGESPPLPSGPCVVRDILRMAEDAVLSFEASNAVLRAQIEHVADYLKFRSKAEKSRWQSPHMLVGMATSMEKVCPRGKFCAHAIPADGLSLRLAGNECESIQLLVAPREHDLKNVRLSAEGMKGPGDATYPLTNIDCHVMGYVNVKRTAPYRVGRTSAASSATGYVRGTAFPDTGWWPDPILDFLGGVDVAGMDVQSFWIRVRCPAGMTPGVYRGTLALCADDVAPLRIPFAVRVNGFDIGRTSPLPLAITFSPGPTRQYEDKAGLAAADALKNDPLAPVNMWKRHRLEWGDFLADYFITMDSLYYRSCQNFDILERLEGQGRLGVFNLGYWSYPSSTNAAAVASWRERALEPLRKAYQEAKKRGLLGQAYLYGCDEVKKEFMPSIRLAAQMLKAEFPGVPLSTTAYDGNYGVASPLDCVDWFTPLSERYDQKKAAASRAAGHKVWWYICCGPKAPYANMFVECQAIEARMLMGAMAVRMRPDGFLYYQTSIWNSKRCIETGPFTDWEPRSWTTYHGDGSWICAGPDGRPLPTIRLENFRDGLEDFAYAMVLEKALAVHGEKNDVWSRRAQELLAVPRDVMDTMKNYSDDPAVLYRWRDAMADLIESDMISIQQ